MNFLLSLLSLYLYLQTFRSFLLSSFHLLSIIVDFGHFHTIKNKAEFINMSVIVPNETLLKSLTKDLYKARLLSLGMKTFSIGVAFICIIISTLSFILKYSEMIQFGVDFYLWAAQVIVFILFTRSVTALLT